jgi:hypothetical protein
MTRRTTVITPTTQTDALYELPSQPFARRVVSASIYNLGINGLYHNTLPELKIADVEGNVLLAITPNLDIAATTPASPINYLFADLGGSSYNFTAPAVTAGNVYIPATLPTECMLPESNLLTVTLFGSLPGDTIPNLVLVTEDADEDFMIA